MCIGTKCLKIAAIVWAVLNLLSRYVHKKILKKHHRRLPNWVIIIVFLVDLDLNHSICLMQTVAASQIVIDKSSSAVRIVVYVCLPILSPGLCDDKKKAVSVTMNIEQIRI